jgi:hypothetical protein
VICGVDLAKIIARGDKNKQMNGFCAELFPKPIGKNRHSYCSLGDI